MRYEVGYRGEFSGKTVGKIQFASRAEADAHVEMLLKQGKRPSIRGVRS